MLFGATILELIQSLLGGGGGGGVNLLSIVAIALAAFALFKKPAPSPGPTPAPVVPPNPAPQASPLDLSRLEQGLMQLHAAATDVGSSQAIDPARIATLLQTVVQAWPLIVFFAGMFGIKLPPLPINPTPPQASRQ